jgi:hypothetical protein
MPDTGFGFASFLPANAWGVVQNGIALVLVVYKYSCCWSSRDYD